MKNLKQLREATGRNQPDLARLIGVTKQTLYKWERGMSPVSPTHWAKYASLMGVDSSQFEDALIETLLAYALETADPKGIAAAQKSGRYDAVKMAEANAKLLRFINSPDQASPSRSNVAKPDRPFLKLPVIAEAAAAQCNTAYYPISDWAKDCAEEEVGFSEGREGDFVIRVTGDSMLPWYPPGTLILARPNVHPQSGDRVVAVLADGSVVFKVFAEKEEFFFLLSVNSEDGQDFKFRKTDYSAVRAIYQVIQSMRDERALDRAMSQKGIIHFWQEKIQKL